MRIYELGTGYTSIPAKVSAATESIVEELTKAFINMNVDVEILDVSDKNRASHSIPITEVKVPSIFTKSDVSLGIIHKLKRVVYSVALAKKIKKILKKSDEKVVLHFHNQYNLFFFLKLTSEKIRNKALIAYTNHNGMWSLPWEEARDTIRKRYFQEIAAMEASDIVFALNPKMKKNICDNINVEESKVTVISNGVNTQIYAPLSDSDIESEKAKLSLNDKTVILQVGSVNENKGQERTVRMLAPLLKGNKDVVYAYAGGIVSDEYQTLVGTTAKELGVESQVKYLGTFAPGEEMNRIYNIAAATVCVSRYEGFPLVCIESLSAGVPVVICNDSQLDFGDGCVVSAKDTFAADFAEIISAKAGDISAKARENALSNYTWDAIAKDYIAKIKAVC